jgi:hypothetical protein
LATLEAALSRVEARLAQTPMAAAGPAVAAPAAAAPPAPPAQAQAPAARSEQRDRAPRDAPTRLAQLDATYRAETPRSGAQSAWAQSAAASVQTALIAAAPPGLSASIDCRAQSCRVTLAMRADQVQQWLPQASMQLAGTFGSVQTVESAGQTTVYFRP